MDGHNATMKAFEMKAGAQLDEVKAKLAEIKAQAKGVTAAAELNTLTELQKAHATLEKQRGDLHKTESSKADLIKAGMTTHLAELKDKVEALHTKLHDTAAAK